jgi:NADPH-dependent glutamate synthase beta subunit-like oxidoreductase
MDQIPQEQLAAITHNRVVKPGNQRVAIVGAGPSGLSAAYYLVLMGYRVTVYEKYPQAGGMMRYGMPEYRLPYDILDKDINFIVSLGVELKTNTTVGKDLSLETIQKENDVVMLASGFHGGRSTRVPGTDHRMVFQAVDLLARITKGEDFPVEREIVVIGGGNVAMDMARSLARLQKKKYGQVNLIVTCLETRDIMPADDEEIEEGTEEGITFYPGRGPEEIIIENDQVRGLKTSRCTRVFNDQKMFAPEFDKTDIQVFPASMVVEAIGQAPEFSYFDPFKDQVEMNGRRIKVDSYYQTSLPWLFVLGDIIKGPDVINGIETGHQAALGVDYYLTHREHDEISTMDDLLGIARQYQQAQVEGLETLLNQGFFVPEDFLSRLATSKDAARAQLVRLDELLLNKNTRIHLRQELPRVQRRRDYDYLLRFPSITVDSKSSMASALAESFASGFRLYKDLLFLTKSKEMEFALDTLAETSKKMEALWST